MHDRRIDGTTYNFGNAGALLMNAMTWYDHETESIWSQPWGRAIQGELKGVELYLLPSQLTTWTSWRAEHPNTLVMINDVDRLRRRLTFDEDFVIGLIMAEKAKAYYYFDVARVKIVNDTIEDLPVVVWAEESNFHAFVRQVEGQTLTFDQREGKIVDVETGSSWDFVRGLAVEGPLRGQGLQPVPSTSAFDWAWLDFYPNSTIYEPSTE